MTVSESAHEHIDRFIQARLEHDGITGLSLAVTGRDEQLRATSYGYADLAARELVTPEHLFEFGSIGKSFTAIVLLQLEEAGEIDLHAPVAEYLPWFDIQSAFAPITIHHLLSHTAGITGGSDFSGDPRFEVWDLRNTRAMNPPGEHFHYSNVGYKTLGLVLEETTGQSYAELVQSRILDPLGMRDTFPVITHDTRRRLAVGYRGFYDDRPWHRSHGRVPATWLETNTADGCIASTAADLAIYLRMLMNRGQGPSGRIISDASFESMITPVIEREPGQRYGYGLMIWDVGGRTLIGHGGGMVGYYALMAADVEAGLGIVTLINAPGEQLPIAEYIFEVLRAEANNEPIPEAPEIPEPTHIDNAADFAGVYRSDSGHLELIEHNRQLRLRYQDSDIVLETRGEDRFYVPHPDFGRFLLQFQRDDDEVVTDALYGTDWYRNQRYEGPEHFACPDEWLSYPGHYRCYNPWLSNFRIVIRKGELILIYPGGDQERLTTCDNGRFRVGDEYSPEFIRFDTIVDGQALGAKYSSQQYYRFFTP